MSELFTDTVLNMMTATLTRMTTQARMVFFTADKCRTAKRSLLS